jgi:CDP-diacylglycerol---glycerol-3-phosphate 3-phosphatidyltransferase
MVTIPNILSLLRIPLALAFFQQNVAVRAVAVLLALCTDGLDGYIARHYKQTTRLGTVLDPVTDRFFVVVAVCTLYAENRLQAWQIAALFCRDLSILLFGFYLFLKGSLAEYYLRAIWCGKITTVVQLGVLLSLIANLFVPDAVYYTLIALGFLALIELGFSNPGLSRQEGPPPSM